MAVAAASKTAAPSSTKTAASTAEAPVDALIKQDSYLKDFREALQYRYQYYRDWKQKIGDLNEFSRAYTEFGFQVDSKNNIRYQEWAPNATSASLVGDFNNWDVNANTLQKDEYGVWRTQLPAKNGKLAIPHNSKVKISFELPSKERVYRIPAWINRVSQDISVSPVYDGVFWHPDEQYKWQHKRPKAPTNLRIYEAHVGIASPEAKVATYDHFTTDILPRIAKLGYNTIQLMAIMEHPYYASFGYQVTSFFAASSRYGTPEQLKKLIDTAHGLNITVLLDLVHSHSANNTEDGLNNFDGSDHCYFHSLPKGRHELWDSRLFNYANFEVLRFLLSNVRYWMDEYQFDGFRFDGVTSMLYHHHGIAFGFSGNYHEYFGLATDVEALGYLMLANDVVHAQNGITIAEDVSGMPTLCRPTEEGGIGFDYRLAMAVPDLWIKYLKEKADEDWDIGEIVFTLVNRRYGEKHIAYAESHDQALVGDKTLAFWLMDKEMYDWMTVLKPETPIIDRGIALHKMIRLLTYGLGGEGYLNFIGNEFGHPEWLDFPRAGNGNSFHYARRQFNLPDDKLLRYQHLNNFDAAMHHLEEKERWLTASHQWISTKHQDDKVIVFERGDGLVWAFNFHGHKSFDGYRIGTLWEGSYRVVLSSDDHEFGGHDRVDKTVVHKSSTEGWNGRPYSIQVYLPTRTVIILKRVD